MSDTKGHKTGQSIPDEAKSSNHFSICKFSFKFEAYILFTHSIKIRLALFLKINSYLQQRQSENDLYYHDMTFYFTLLITYAHSSLFEIRYRD
jgi:hypothetical protein